MEITKKIVLLGQFGVGKTSLVQRFIKNEFTQDYRTTLGVQIEKKIINLPSGATLSMIIWDLEGFSSVDKTRSSYLLGSSAFIHVFDLTRPVTYSNLHEEINFLRVNFPKVLLRTIGNKSDQKDPESVANYLKSKNINIYGFVSAKTGEGVNELFKDIALNLSDYEH